MLHIPARRREDIKNRKKEPGGGDISPTMRGKKKRERREQTGWEKIGWCRIDIIPF